MCFSGKDQIIFATKEDMLKPSEAIINMEEDEEDKQPGNISLHVLREGQGAMYFF